jgi:hypothetical protein
MCGFYDNNSKINKGDKARYNSKDITIVSVTHIKQARTMDITFIDDTKKETTVNIPYMTSGYGFEKRNI